VFSGFHVSVENYTYNAYDPNIRSRIFFSILNGSGMRATARTLRIARDTVTDAPGVSKRCCDMSIMITPTAAETGLLRLSLYRLKSLKWTKCGVLWGTNRISIGGNDFLTENTNMIQQAAYIL
jgi:hypothetical protein